MCISTETAAWLALYIKVKLVKCDQYVELMNAIGNGTLSSIQIKALYSSCCWDFVIDDVCCNLKMSEIIQFPYGDD